MIDELMRYSYENKRKFDIVAAFGICLLADEDMIGKVARPVGGVSKKLSFGYTRNEMGQVSFGKINNTENNLKYDWVREGREGFDRRLI